MTEQRQGKRGALHVEPLGGPEFEATFQWDGLLPEWSVWGIVTSRGGSLRIRELSIVSASGVSPSSGIGAQVLREIPVGWIVSTALGYLEERAAAEGRERKAGLHPGGLRALLLPSAESLVAALRTQPQRGGRWAYSASFYARVAELYLRIREEGRRDVYRAILERFEAARPGERAPTVHAIRAWVSKARGLGYLPRTGKQGELARGPGPALVRWRDEQGGRERR